MAEKNLEFGRRLEHFIFEAGLKKKKLADSIGVSPSAIGAYINEGRIPEAPILLKISQLLNKTMEELLTGEEPTPHAGTAEVWAYEHGDVASLRARLLDKFLEVFPPEKQLHFIGAFRLMASTEGEKKAVEALDELQKVVIEELKKTG